MEKTRFFITLIIITGLAAMALFPGCKKDSDDENVAGPTSMTDERDGQVYNVVTIGSQVWMAENLNYSVGSSDCYENDDNNCNKYGSLYTWNDAKVACPSGWHLPSDQELKQLEGTVDSQFGVGDPSWDLMGWRGFDVALGLKSKTGWVSDSSNITNASGFTALPGGLYFNGSYAEFANIESDGLFWSSTEKDGDEAWCRSMLKNFGQTARYTQLKVCKLSVRCVKDVK